MTCNCIVEVDEKLADRNTRLSRGLLLGGNDGNPGLMLRTEQIETGRGKAKATALFLSFCPFCGTAYGPEEPK